MMCYLNYSLLFDIISKIQNTSSLFLSKFHLQDCLQKWQIKLREDKVWVLLHIFSQFMRNFILLQVLQKMNLLSISSTFYTQILHTKVLFFSYVLAKSTLHAYNVDELGTQGQFYHHLKSYFCKSRFTLLIQENGIQGKNWL